jgi:hypothetical protein
MEEIYTALYICDVIQEKALCRRAHITVHIHVFILGTHTQRIKSVVYIELKSKCFLLICKITLRQLSASHSQPSVLCVREFKTHFFLYTYKAHTAAARVWERSANNKKSACVDFPYSARSTPEESFCSASAS